MVSPNDKYKEYIRNESSNNSITGISTLVVSRKCDICLTKLLRFY